jgi:hypothetical protein
MQRMEMTTTATARHHDGNFNCRTTSQVKSRVARNETRAGKMALVRGQRDHVNWYPVLETK